MTKSLIYIFAIALLAGLSSCRDFSFSSYTRGASIASVGDKNLYINDIKSIFTPGMSAEDSVARLNAYIDLWVKNQLKVQMAETRFSENEQDIEAMVENYRNSLLIHKFEEDFVARNMDTVILNSEITEYYRSNRNEFILASPLVKGYMVKIPVGFRQESKVRELARTGREDSVNELIDIAIKNGLEYHEYPEWTDYSTPLSLMPRLSSRDYERLQDIGGFIETADNGYKYFLNFTYILKAGEYTPAEMAAGTIRVMILNRRKQETIRNMEDSIYNDAIAKKIITIKEADI